MAWDQNKYKKKRYATDPEYRKRIRENAKKSYRRRHHIEGKPLPKQKRPSREEQKRQWQERYRDKNNKKARELYQTDPEYKAKVKEVNRRTRERIRNDPVRAEKKRQYFRMYNLKRKYGLSPEDFEQMFKAQGSVCAICQTPDSGPRFWNIDHCHKSGRVRGILCGHCNTMLAHARDRPDVLQRGIAYLTQHSVVSNTD